MRCSHSLWLVYGMKEPERDAVKVKVTQSCPSLCNPMTIQYMEFSRPEYWSGWSEVKLLSRVRLFETPWTVAYQAIPSMGFSRQQYWSGLPFPSPEDLLDPGIKTIPMEKKCQKAKWLSGEVLPIAVKRREVKNKGEKERYKHRNVEFQRIARRDKKAFLSDQCKEIEENNRMGKTRDLFKKN